MIHVNHENSDNTWLYRVKIEKSPFAPCSPFLLSLQDHSCPREPLLTVWGLYFQTYIFALMCTYVQIYIYIPNHTHIHTCIHNGFSFENKITLHMFLFF